jgi:hypothetical protein
MDTVHTLLTAAGHASLGIGLGVVMDVLYPKYDPKVDDVRLLLETLGQFALGYVAVSESMRMLLPRDDGYISPIGDGTSIYFFYMVQPSFELRVLDIASRLQRKVQSVVHDVEGHKKKPKPAGAPAGASAAMSAYLGGAPV